ncbi:uncharacterized protein LOC21405845 isoform X2 [Morus notabilis]|uniref:uncharacterized protein LOC21405845 isoform X2 n=1 Tax=Morus notabilis TaxID=981085 RepID=UPI000CED6166|nr:uncharacterized protein LOC21405845 isoform X2 [Morus notabilis]
MVGKKELVLGFLSRLEPVEAHLKNNKRGLGADKVKKKALKPLDTKTTTIPDGKSEQKIYQKRLQLGFGAVVGRRGLVTHSGHTNRSNYCEQGISNLPNPLLGSHVVDSVPSIRWHDVRLWVFVTWSGWLLGEVWLPPRGSPPTLIAITASFSSNPSSH